MSQKTAIIIGAGPAGLTAAYELAHKAGIKPVVFEKNPDAGGIARTVIYKGNRMDLGGHRFFSKSDAVVQWWLSFLPLLGGSASPVEAQRQDQVMVVRRRLSRIYFSGKFFDYPVTLNRTLIANLGMLRLCRIALSYARYSVFPLKDESSLENFFINRFGRELYRLFFKEYTQKVWGVPCSEIPAEWGSQRVKGLSVAKALSHALRRMLPGRKPSPGQKDTETSLIEEFMYPKLGAGALWDEVSRQAQLEGAEIRTGQSVTGLRTEKGAVVEAQVRDERTGRQYAVAGDLFFSTMPVRDLVAGMGEGVPAAARQAAQGLQYRDFLTIGLLVKKTKFPIKDNWVYIQEPGVKIGRLQIFNNWSPYMVKDPDTVWLGLEYFCSQGDGFWELPEQELITIGVGELSKLGFIGAEDVLDAVVVRVEKAYPAYFGTYKDFPLVREFTDTFANLFLIGRNGMHRYNNMDHSMLSAMQAVRNAMEGRTAKGNIWSVNAEQEYSESRSGE